MNDTWLWNGSTWAQQFPPVSPPPRYEASIAYDAAKQRVVLFGGSSCSSSAPCTSLNDTWTWNGSTWAQQSPASSPSVRYGASTTYDSATSNVLLIGGFSCPSSTTCSYLGDTWIWDGATWTQQRPLGSPTSRRDAGIAVDAAHSQVVLFGGFGPNGYLNDTLIWDGRTWHYPGPVLQPAITSISPAAGPTTGGLSVVITGTNLSAFGYSTNITFGGNPATNAGCFNASFCSATSPQGSGIVDVRVNTEGEISPIVEADRFSYILPTNPNWIQQHPVTSPPARSAPAMAYDEATGTTVLFGGSSCVANSCSTLNDTWTWNGSVWTQQAVTGGPPALATATMVYDSASRTLVLFGGEGCNATNCYIPNDTWTWDGSAWTQQHPATSPLPRQFATMAYDPAHGQVVLFGGCCYDNDTNGTNDTWTWNGSTWTQQIPTMNPPVRFSASMAYDIATHTVVLFGGTSCSNTGCSALNDTWTWNGTTWAEQHPATSPSIRHGAQMAYDVQRNTLLLFGGAACPFADRSVPCLIVNDSWAWDGSTWTQQFPATASQVRVDGAMAYDIVHGQIVIFGGCCGSTGDLNDTWTIGNGTPSTSVPSPCPNADPNHYTVCLDPSNGPVVAGSTIVQSVKVTIPIGKGLGHWGIREPGTPYNPSTYDVACTPHVGSCTPAATSGQFLVTGSSAPRLHDTVILATLQVTKLGLSSAPGRSRSVTAATETSTDFTPAVDSLTDENDQSVLAQTNVQPAKVVTVVTGDVNGDGAINAVDALCVLRNVAGLTGTQACPAVPLQVPSPANVNPDTVVNAVDALCILRSVAVLPATDACPQIPLASVGAAAAPAVAPSSPLPSPVPARRGT